VYSRPITVPDSGQSQVTKLVLGAVNHAASVYLTPVGVNPATVGPLTLGKPIGTTTTSFTPTSFDLTPYVQPGRSYTLSVDVKGRMALRDPAGYFTVPEAASWSPNVTQGIFRSAELDIYPTVYVSDVVVHTSVPANEFSYDIAVTNESREARTVTLTGALASANRRGCVRDLRTSTSVINQSRDRRSPKSDIGDQRKSR
jgi:hypothetical protein